MAQVEPWAEVTKLPEEQWAAFVISDNGKSTDRTPGQKAASEALVKGRAGKRKDGRWVGWTKDERATGENSRKLSDASRKMQEQSGVIWDHARDS